MYAHLWISNYDLLFCSEDYLRAKQYEIDFTFTSYDIRLFLLYLRNLFSILYFLFAKCRFYNYLYPYCYTNEEEYGISDESL